MSDIYEYCESPFLWFSTTARYYLLLCFLPKFYCTWRSTKADKIQLFSIVYLYFSLLYISLAVFRTSPNSAALYSSFTALAGLFRRDQTFRFSGFYDEHEKFLFVITARRKSFMNSSQSRVLRKSSSLCTTATRLFGGSLKGLCRRGNEKFEVCELFAHQSVSMGTGKRLKDQRSVCTKKTAN